MMTNVSCDMLLHPELLTNEQLMAIIQERQLRVPNMAVLPRDELLELFHHYCVPYGQRKYRDTGRGKMLNRSRHMSPESSPKLTLNNDNNNRKLGHSVTERLKPPPDLLSGHMKRIKLDNKVEITNDINLFKRKMSIDNAPVPEAPPNKKERKPILWP
ncbi:ashwin-like [Battus philenor]|uniref:ashwin-like n=1 Tax=Battus philenor TaxID=42288 RepID=UPI0035CE888F